MAESSESAMKTLNPLLGKCSPAGSSTTAQRLEELIPEAHGLSTSSSTLKENYPETNSEGSCKTLLAGTRGRRAGQCRHFWGPQGPENAAGC